MKHLIQDYFGIKELVCPHVFAAFGEKAWQFMDCRLLDTLYIIRKNIDRPIIVNDWSDGGNFSQRGLRCNVCQLVKTKSMLEKVYMSAHIQGLAVDFHVKGMTANETRLWIVENQVLLPYPIRIEVGFNPTGKTETQIRQAIRTDSMSWVHIDLRGEGQKITYFKG